MCRSKCSILMIDQKINQLRVDNDKKTIAYWMLKIVLFNILEHPLYVIIKCFHDDQ